MTTLGVGQSFEWEVSFDLRLWDCRRAFLIMETKKLPFLGDWSVVLQEHRIGGEWLRESESQQCVVTFLPGGDFDVISQENNEPAEILASFWDFNETTGIISFYRDRIGEFLECCVFTGGPDGSPGELWLYFFEDKPHICREREIIIAHHAYERWQLVRLGSR